ncbi:MAG: hypothetical protein LBG66_03965, partial [Gallionellaceae bacterium]|nr:hypothetical protein [Gallionellaceae bacterium]
GGWLLSNECRVEKDTTYAIKVGARRLARWHCRARILVCVRPEGAPIVAFALERFGYMDMPENLFKVFMVPATTSNAA